MSESENLQHKREGNFDFNSVAKKSKMEKVEKSESFIEIEADAAEDKGSRHTMEDAWVVRVDAFADSPDSLRCAHFAIYDGHGGRLAAEYAQKHLHATVVSAGLPRPLFLPGVSKLELDACTCEDKDFLVSKSCGVCEFIILDVKAAKKAILEGFRKTDESLLQESALGGWQDGATAVCVWVLGQTVFVANVGDAKAVVARSVVDGSQNHTDGLSSLKAIVVTREHKAIYPQERARIQKVFQTAGHLLMAGGTVSTNGRLQGRLEVSRALGDRQFKKFGVVATPDIHSFELTNREEFIILGCDGLWGAFLDLR
ncbi:hypothetical protein Pint_16936 [Pistacia integerrima]|uniref:Uncharacterized protein n=1 Tax=Pistacia integerrima TaxID=434235 RepID=A0ACC0ZGW3_9ROSI|nr:hypothetical protein Pint_16936 [Pistacia integerrima]